MYEFLRAMMNIADIVKGVAGTIENVTMGEYLSGQDRIHITGKTGDGQPFALTLEVGEWKKA